MSKAIPSEQVVKPALTLDLDISSLAQLSLSQDTPAPQNSTQDEEVASMLLNENGSVWLHGQSESTPTEILDLENNTAGKLGKGEVAQVRSGQGVGISGNYFKLNIEGSTVSLSSLGTQPTTLQVKKHSI